MTFHFPSSGHFLLAAALSLLASVSPSHAGGIPPPATPFSSIGVEAQKQYSGAGIGISRQAGQTVLESSFQKLRGESTASGLWVQSTDPSATGRFQLKATSLGRELDSLPPVVLQEEGTVETGAQSVKFLRPGVVEEYSVSLDGVRQDFLISTRPAGSGKLRLALSVDGAAVQPAAYGARLVLDGSAREIAYSRLKVTDAQGRILPAVMEVASASRVDVLVDDARAVYPVTIDPTFSDADWVSLGSLQGANEEVRALAFDAQGNLYIGGLFTIAGNAQANRIAKWDGRSWAPLGSGVNGEVHALMATATHLYVGGSFTEAGGVTGRNRIARWDVSATGNQGWSGLGSGLSHTVRALAVTSTDLYVGGDFVDAAADGYGDYIVGWRLSGTDDSAWFSLGTGVRDGDGRVRSLAISGNDLYVGGDFNTAGAATHIGIAKWSLGSTGNAGWSGLGTGVNGFVHALAAVGPYLYVGGQFTVAGGNSNIQLVGQWTLGGANDSAWSALGSGVEGTGVFALAVSGTDVYVGGNFTSAGGISGRQGVAKWRAGSLNNNGWSALGSGIGGTVRTLAASGSELYVGGNIAATSTVGGINGRQHVARWALGGLDNSAWSGLGTGVGGTVRAMKVAGGHLYLGGNFHTVGSLVVNGIVKWDGNTWSTLGSGLGWEGADGGVWALEAGEGGLYVGGVFTTAGAEEGRIGIARWSLDGTDNSGWSGLGSGIGSLGLPGAVRSLAVTGGHLYVGGSFSVVGGVDGRNNIARWTLGGGSNEAWSALGSGTDGPVNALAANATDVYAGGTFTQAGGSSASLVAKWNIAGNGNAGWSPLAGGILGGIGAREVHALALTSTALYVGGRFDGTNNGASPGLTKWTLGATTNAGWSAVGQSLGPVIPHSLVKALAVVGPYLYIGGEFDVAGRVGGRNNLVRWELDGTDIRFWSNLGSGTNGPVYALADYDGALYAGGAFTRAGDKVSAYVAKATFSPSLEILGNSTVVPRGAATPALANHTDFGSTNILGGTVSRVFTVHNLGGLPLQLTGIPRVQIVGEQAASFAVTVQPESTLAPDASSTFTVVFDPAAPGLHTAVVRIQANDNEDPYTFAIQGTGQTGAVAVTGAGQPIPSGSTTPSVSNHTDFGSNTITGRVTQVFTLQNSGPVSLNLTGSPLIAVTGAHAADFTVGALPATQLAPGATTTFSLVFSPSAIGLRSATVGIASDAAGQSPYTFAVQGTGTPPSGTDLRKPTLVVASPVGTALSGPLPLSVTGTVGDNSGVDRVEISLNGSAPLLATLGSRANPAAVPFSATVTPLLGGARNTLRVTAYDLYGNATMVTRTFTFSQRFLLTVTRELPAGSPTVPENVGSVTLTASPATAATALQRGINPQTSAVEAGRVVRLAAVARPGYLFSHWTGLPAGSQTYGNVVLLMMPQAAVPNVTAVFVDSALDDLGAPPMVQGLLQPAPGVQANNGTVGQISATANPSTGSFTAKIFMDGEVLSLTGVLLGNGSVWFNSGGTLVPSVLFSNKVVRMSWSNTGLLVRMTGNGQPFSEGFARLARFNRANPAPSNLLNKAGRQGYMTLSFPSLPQGRLASTFPQGAGYASMTIEPSGTLKLTGKLADGTSVTASSFLVEGYVSPIFFRLPHPGTTAHGKGRGGSFLGTLSFDTTLPDSDVTSPDMSWFRPAVVQTAAVGTQLYTQGWPTGILVGVRGALYNSSRSVESTLNLLPDYVQGNAELSFEHGRLPAGVLLMPRFNIQANRVTKRPPALAGFGLQVTPQTGLIRGSFTPDWTSPARTLPAFQGILLQKGPNATGTGYFISNRVGDLDPESGSVTLGRP